MTPASGAEPRDTLVVVGGPALSRVDADAVALAAARLDDAAASLRAAAMLSIGAAADLRHAAWVGDPVPDGAAADPAVLRQCAALAADVADRLSERASACLLIAQRLRIAAGLYRHTESTAERVLGGLVSALAAGAAHGVTAALRSPAGRVVVDVAVPAGLWITSRPGAGPDAGPDSRPDTGPDPGTIRVLREPGPRPDPAEGVIQGLTRASAPITDEVVAGLAFGVASAEIVRAGGSLGVTGGARVLSSAVHDLVPASRVDVDPVADLPSWRPVWAGQPSGTVAEALARTADLYPWGGGIAGRPVPGVPEGTLAVEQVQHTDGTTSWTVLVPGTQGLLPADHPFDAVTDLDLMAHRAADVTVAVERALAQAGARPHEPVVLVGHSLGGIAAMALASSDGFRHRHRLGGVVTAGSPTATFAAPRGVPVLHLENDEELVSQVDGRSSAENPATRDRVTVSRALRASSAAGDRAASGSVARAHGMDTHLRTLLFARDAGSAQVADVVGRLEALLDGQSARSRFFTARRRLDVDAPVVLAPGAPEVSPASGRTAR